MRESRRTVSIMKDRGRKPLVTRPHPGPGIHPVAPLGVKWWECALRPTLPHPAARLLRGFCDVTAPVARRMVAVAT